ncbi:MAG TPA: single-stranded DNA-binding protein [Nocardioidaceae bacterium]|nr:single-stranded DNA-binding protein [Nocardioidaceae bacterium]
MSDVNMTLHGYVGAEVEFKQTGRGDLASFRVGTTPRIRDGHGGYRNGETTWTQVAAWRTLAGNVAASISVGDPVVVIGRLRTSRWTTPEGEPRERTILDATTVAHDLARGTSVFRKNPRTTPRDDDDETVNEVLERVGQVPPNIDPVTGELRAPAAAAQPEPEVAGVDQAGAAA